jgi:hypothetical protein
MKYAVEMGSCIIIYIPSFIKIGSGIQKLTGVIFAEAGMYLQSRCLATINKYIYTRRLM